MKNKVCDSIGTTSVCGECKFGRFHEDAGNIHPCAINKAAVIIPVTRWVEIFCAGKLKNCSYQPGAFDKSFVMKINTSPEYIMSEKGRNFMFTLLYKYRRQINNYQKVRQFCMTYFNYDPEINKK